MRLRDCCQSFSAAALGLAALPAWADCPAPDALYRLATDPQGTQGEMRLVAAPLEYLTGLLLVLTLPGGQRVEFEMSQGQGYGSATLWTLTGDFLPTPENGFPLSMFAAAADGKLVPYGEGLPFPDTPAPAAFFVTGLGASLWYNAVERTGTDPAIWYLHACGP